MMPKTKQIRRIILTFIIFSIALLTLLVLYSLSLSLLIETRFSGRRWQIPSRVFSDTTLLYPCQRLNPESLREKLLRLQYREIISPPEKKGEMQSTSDHFDIFLNDVQLKTGKREGFLVRIQHQNSIIEVMVRLDTGDPLPILEIEPEELALFFGPEREKRQLVSIQHVPDHIIRAVIAIEDSRFYEHHGISPLGILRATYMNLRYGRIKQGGSTITQQLGKN